MLIGQPGHCALIWAKPNIAGSWDWRLYNDISGIHKSTRHERIQTPWLNSDFMGFNTGWWRDGYMDYKPIWMVFAFNMCLKNIGAYIKSTLDNSTYYDVCYSDSGLPIFTTKHVII